MNNNDFVYFSLGSNLDNKINNILETIEKFKKYNIKIIEISPVYETPALLLKNSPSDWNRTFQNCVLKADTNIESTELLKICKKIELELGRDFSKKWGPRPIDIDIIFYKNQNINSENLQIPHKEIYNRNFVLDPLSFIYPEKARNYYKVGHQPLIMGILNITPDSFSNDGKYNNFEEFIKIFNLWEQNQIQIIDIGAESTRPGAESLEFEEELKRLEKVFDFIKNYKFNKIKPLLSMDTYHYKTAEKAIENGFNIINDVSGLADENMIALAKNNKDIKFVFMHNLGIPSNKKVTIPENKNVIEEVKTWLENKLNLLEKNNIKKDQLIFDIGIGFGKTPSQDLQLLQNIKEFHKFGIKILVGHSRKSFMKIFSNMEAKDRDFETLAISLKLMQNVDILRVHTPLEHKRAFLGFGHLENQFI